ncbi:hypothetical protein ACHAQA_004699 [Verticillium albo-atrum]
MSQVIESEDDDGDSAVDVDSTSQDSDEEDEQDGPADDDLSDARSTSSRGGRERKESAEAKEEEGNDCSDSPPAPASEASQRGESPVPEWTPYVEPVYGLVNSQPYGKQEGIDFDVVLVHGLHGKKGMTWEDEVESWDKNLIKEDLFGYWSIRQLPFWYDTNWKTTHIYFPEGIEMEAQRLLDDLVEARKNRGPENPLPIVFIGHDIGGLIVKKALVLAASNPAKYGSIPWETSTLIFLTVPHRVTNHELLEDELLDLISMDPVVPSLVRKASQLARNIMKVNAEFQDTNMLVRASVFSVYSRRDPDVPRKIDECHCPFGRFTVVYEIPFEYCCSTTRSHREMVQKPAEGESDWAIEIKRVINELPYYTNINQTIATESKVFLASTPPIYPYQGKDYHDDICSWFEHEEATAEWLANDRGLSIMHIQHDVENRARGVSQAIFTSLFTHLNDNPKLGKNWICYFRFDKDDARYRDVKPMLITFLATLVCRFSFDVGSVAEKMVEDWSRNMYSCDLADIFQAFMNLRDNFNAEKVTFFVGCFDQCEEESRNWFLKELLRFGSLKESRDKWLFDSSDPMFLQEVQSGIWRLNVEDSPLCQPVVSPSLGAIDDKDLQQPESIKDIAESINGSVKGETVSAEEGENVSREDETKKDIKEDTGKIDDGKDEQLNVKPKAVEAETAVTGEASLPADNVGTGKANDIVESQDPDDVVVSRPGSAQSDNSKASDPALGSRILRALDERPVLFNVEDAFRALVSQDEGQSSKPARAVLDWVFRKSANASTATVEALVARPKSLDPDEIFRSMIDFVDEKTQAQAHRLVRLLRHSLRPLSTHEAAIALSITTSPKATLTDADVAGILDPLLHNFPGVVELSGREICVWPLFAPLSGDKDEDAHGAMASLCLEYLSRADVHPLIDEHSDFVAKAIWVAFESRHDFVSYATRYWLDHYHLAGSCAPSDEAYIFLSNMKAARSWREAALSRAMYGFPSRHYLSPIPLIASTGLEDLLARRLEEDKDSATFQLDCNLAVSEAACNNHTKAVELLLKSFDPSPASLGDAFRLAATDGRDAVLEILIEYASRPDNIGKVDWPDDVLVKLGWLGRHQHMQRLLALGVTPDPKDRYTLEPLDPSPISISVGGPHLDAVKVLLDAKVDFTILSKKGSAPFMSACQNGDPEVIKVLIASGADIEVKNDTGITPLQGATDWGRLKAVEVLLEHGADYNVGQIDDKEANSSSWKPVVQASENNYAKVLALLLAKGADANSTGPKGCALYLAAKQGYVDICQMLLEHGASANTPKTEFAPALSVAVESQKVELVRLLLDHGADIEAEFQPSKEDEMNTALTLASRLGLDDIAELLLERGANPNHHQDDLDPPIYLACWRGYVDIVRMLLDKGADPNAKLDGQAWTAVHAAYDNPEVMRLLLAKGGDPDRVSGSGTALHLAVRWDNLETLKALLENSPTPDLEAEDEDKMSALARACTSRASEGPEMVRLLLDAGANPNHGVGTDNLPLHQCITNDACLQALLEARPQLDAKDEQGNTALHRIASLDSLDVLRKLVVGGADIEAVNDQGHTPLAIAVKIFHGEDTVLYLLKKGAQPHVSAPGFAGVLHEALRTSGLTVLKALIKAGADINAVSEVTGASVLYSACYQRGDSTETVKYLVEELEMPVNVYGGQLGWPLSRAAMYSDNFEYLLSKGADPEVEDSVGRRTIHMSAMAMSGANLKTLVDRGVSVVTPDKMGMFPLHYAALRKNTEAIETLLEQPGVSVNVRDADGWTPLMWACVGSWRIQETLEMLIAKGADIWARGAGWDKEWSPLRLARFHNQSEEACRLLEPDDASKLVKSEAGLVWDDDFHQIAAGDSLVGECFACMSFMCGKRWQCMSCPDEADVSLCFKCYRYKDSFHGQHEFKEDGFEFYDDRTRSIEAAGNATPHTEHGDHVSGSGSESGDAHRRKTRSERRSSHNSNSNSDSDSNSSVGIEDEDSDEGLQEEDESSDDGK